LLIPLIPALIWAIVPLVYKSFIIKEEILKVNFLRMGYSSLILLFPFLFLGFNKGIIYGMLSGMISLALGDSLFLFSIRKVGASIAVPVAYTYVLFSQYIAYFLGENIGILHFISSVLIIIGLFLLSKEREFKLRITGIILSLITALIWAIGQSLIKLATMEKMDPLSIAFSRTLAAFVILGIILGLKKEKINLKVNEQTKLGVISVLDLVLGSSLFIISISIIGLGLTVIITSLSPFLTQIISKITGKENPKIKDIVGGLMIVLAVILMVII